MIADREQLAMKRITVTLDASEPGRVPLETAVRLAAITGASVEGVFIEDVNLTRLSGLSFLREVRPWSAGAEAVSPQRMQRELRVLARRAQQMLEQAAVARGVSWTFQVWRGRAEAAVLASELSADILSLGRVSSLVSSRLFAASRVRGHRARVADSSISVLFTASEPAARALATACSLASDMGAALTVVLPGVQPADLAGLRQKAQLILQQHAQVARLVSLAGDDVLSLERAAGRTGTRILVTEAGHPLVQQAGLDRCLEAHFSPVLLLR